MPGYQGIISWLYNLGIIKVLETLTIVSGRSICCCFEAWEIGGGVKKFPSHRCHGCVVCLRGKDISVFILLSQVH